MKGKLLLLSVALLSQLIFSSCSREPADYLNNGIKEFESGDYDSAITNLRRAKYLMPDSFEVNLYLGKSFLKNPAATDAQYKARYYLNTAKELAKTPQHRFDVGMTLLGNHLKQKDYPKIIKEGKALVKEHKALLNRNKAYEIETVLADAYFHNKDYEEAAETLDYVIKSYEAELSANEEAKARAYIQLAAATIKADKARAGDALTYLTTVKEIEKDVFSENYKQVAAECYEMIGDHFQSEEKYKISKWLYEKARFLYSHLGNAQKLEDISRKIDIASCEFDKRSDEHPSLMRNGERALARKDYDEAAAYFQEAKEKGLTDAEKAQAISKLGISYFLDGNEKSALSTFSYLKDIDVFEKEYEKFEDKDRVDLFMGAAVILTSAKPADTMMRKLKDKAFNLLPGHQQVEASEFLSKIDQGKALMSSSLERIEDRKSTHQYREAAQICEKVGDRFAIWEMKTDAKDFYEKAKGFHETLFDKDKVIELNKRIEKLG
jgi:tetratricopeptide (TPR) repeat protein